MKKIVLGILITLAVLIVAFYTVNAYIYHEKQATAVANYRDGEYRIEGSSVTLKGGVSIVEAAPGSASKVTTRYFGNDYMVDLDGDGDGDHVFLLTQETGGNGVFYYVVAALNTKRGYIGSDGYFLGDRIAPQTVGSSQNPRHQNVIVVNYADRAVGEPVTAKPSVGESVYLKLDPTSMQWGIVEPNFEGESN